MINKAVLMIMVACVFSASAFGADSLDMIERKLKSRDEAIHLLDDWMRDPFITRGPDGAFYLVGTRKNNIPRGLQGFEVWCSKDLISWENIGVPWNTTESSWMTGDVIKGEKEFRLWAPEIWFLDGRWVGIHTSTLGKANLLYNNSAELKGPFVEPMGADLGRRHDPSFFTDEAGTHWLVWGCSYIAPMKKDWSGLAGDEVELTAVNRKMGHEGSQIVKLGKKYILFATGWSTDQMRKGTYNLYYCTADKLTGPYGERKFAGRCLGHGTIFQDADGEWWCTAFQNGDFVKPTDPEFNDAKLDKAISILPQGTTIVPMSIELQNGDLVVNALDPIFATPGPEEIQQFDESSSAR